MVRIRRLKSDLLTFLSEPALVLRSVVKVLILGALAAGLIVPGPAGFAFALEGTMFALVLRLHRRP